MRRVMGVCRGTRHSHHLVRGSVMQCLVWPSEISRLSQGTGSDPVSPTFSYLIKWKHSSFAVSLIGLSLRVTAVSEWVSDHIYMHQEMWLCPRGGNERNIATFNDPLNHRFYIWDFCVLMNDCTANTEITNKNRKTKNSWCEDRWC